MKYSWRMIARLSSFMSSGTAKRTGFRKIALGSGLAVTTYGLAVTYNDPKTAFIIADEDIRNLANIFSLKKIVSKLDRNEVKAEEPWQTTKPHASQVSSLMKTKVDLPPAQWDYNWDKREPESLVRPLKSNPTAEEIEAYEAKVKEKTPTARRTYILVRHGQYEMKNTDEERILTALGRDQANSAGERLQALWKHKQLSGEFDLNFTMSTMTRATETAQIILKHFPGVESKSCDLIREGAPCEPVPNVIAGLWDPEPNQFFEEGARIEAGFRKYIHRAEPSQKNNSIDVLVCHGNVIRYFVCRALQLPPEAWLRFSVHNASITTITVAPTGRVSVIGLGESGHLTPEKLTFN